MGVTTETYDKARGKLCVVDSLMTRIENVKKTGFADEIIVEETQGQKFNDIKKYDIDIFTVGSDWTGCFDYLKEYCEVVYLERAGLPAGSLRRQSLSAASVCRERIIRIQKVRQGLPINGKLMCILTWKIFSQR